MFPGSKGIPNQISDGQGRLRTSSSLEPTVLLKLKIRCRIQSGQVVPKNCLNSGLWDSVSKIHYLIKEKRRRSPHGRFMVGTLLTFLSVNPLKDIPN